MSPHALHVRRATYFVPDARKVYRRKMSWLCKNLQFKEKNKKPILSYLLIGPEKQL